MDWETAVIPILVKPYHEGNLECVAKAQNNSDIEPIVSYTHYLKVIGESLFYGFLVPVCAFMFVKARHNYKTKLKEHVFIKSKITFFLAWACYFYNCFIAFTVNCIWAKSFLKNLLIPVRLLPGLIQGRTKERVPRILHLHCDNLTHASALNI